MPDDEGPIRITVSKDELTAHLTLVRSGDPEPQLGLGSPSDDPVPEIALDDIYKALSAAGVVAKVDEDRLRMALEKFAEAGEVVDYVVGEGRPPSPGEDAQIDFLYDPEDLICRPEEQDDGSVDLRELNFIKKVNKGDVLATRTAPTQGVPGLNVYGSEIPVKPGRDVPLRAGRNTRISDDGNQLIAETEGVYRLEGTKVSVLESFDIRNNVDYETGNLKSPGHLSISGDVLTGFTVQAAGDIEVGRTVEGARVESEGNILVRGGIQGRDQAVIRAAGNVTSRFIQNADVQAGGDLYITGTVMHSHVVCKGRTVLTGPGASLVGGRLESRFGIEVESLGSTANTRTEVIIGASKEELARLAKMKATVRGDREKIQKLKQRVAPILALLREGARVPYDKSKMLEQSLKMVQQLKQHAAQTIEDAKALEERCREAMSSRIYVRGCVYPNVLVTVNGRSLEVHQELVGPVNILWKNGRIAAENASGRSNRAKHPQRA